MDRFIRFLSVYFLDKKARFNAAVLLGLILNACYIVFNLVLGILQENVWYITVAAYYTLIVILRYLIIDGNDAADSAAHTVSRLLLIVSFPRTGMIIYTVIGGGKSGYPRFVIPIFAAYAVFSIFRAVFGLFVFRKNKTGVHRAAHTIRLALALLSLFNFQTSLLSLISISERLTVALNFITGGGVAITTLALAASGERGRQ